jgi:hypothetical protein
VHVRVVAMYLPIFPLRDRRARCAWHGIMSGDVGAQVLSVLDYKRNQSDENGGTLGHHKFSSSRAIFVFSIQLTAIDDHWSVLARELS